MITLINNTCVITIKSLSKHRLITYTVLLIADRHQKNLQLSHPGMAETVDPLRQYRLRRTQKQQGICLTIPALPLAVPGHRDQRQV